MPKSVSRSTGPHNDLDLAAIHPSLGGKYSPNLHAYLNHRKGSRAVNYVRVFEDDKGGQWLGYYFDGEFSGQRLSLVLCEGAKATDYTFTNLPDLVEVENFWADYTRNGRCAIDKGHTAHFIGDHTRWSESDGHRSCLWCNQVTQVKQQVSKVVVTEHWVNA